MSVTGDAASGGEWRGMLGKSELDLAEVTELREVRAAFQDRITGVRQRATVEGRKFSEAESDQLRRWDRMIAEVNAAIERGEDQHSSRRSAALGPVPDVSTRAMGMDDAEPDDAPAGRGGSPEFSGAMRSVERLVRVGAMENHAATRLEGLLREADPRLVGARYIEAASDPNYRAAFAKILARPQDAHLRMSPAELEAFHRFHEAKRAMNIGTGSEGGYAVPVELDPTILLSSDGSVNPLRSIARVEATISGTWKGISSDGVTAAYVAEGTEADDGTPTLAQPEVQAERAQAFVPFTIEAEQDIDGLAGQLLALFRDARDQLEATKFVSGAGHSSNEPTGIVAALSGGSSEVSTASAGTFVADDVYSLIEDLPPRFQARAQWCANLAILNKIRRFGPTSSEPGLYSDDGSMLLGKAYNELSPMDSDATTSGKEILLVGDFRQFLITDRLGMTVEVVPHVFGSSGRPTGTRGLYCLWRNSSAVLIDNAFRLLKVQ